MTIEAYPDVIVGTDGSPTARCAVQAATVIARSLGARLTVATAWYRDMPDKPVLSELVKIPGGDLGAMEAMWAENTVSSAAAEARRNGVKEVAVATPEGNAADTLVWLSGSKRHSLIVVGTVGLGSRTQRMVGNIPNQISHHAPWDVLLVQTSDPEREVTYRRVALATDGSSTAALAIARGQKVAAKLGADVVLLTVAHSESAGRKTLDRAAAGLPGGDAFGRHIVVGTSTPELLVAAGAEFDLLVVGNKGMTGPSRLLGSVANQVTHQVPTDLLLVNTMRLKKTEK